MFPFPHFLKQQYQPPHQPNKKNTNIFSNTTPSAVFFVCQQIKKMFPFFSEREGHQLQILSLQLGQPSGKTKSCQSHEVFFSEKHGHFWKTCILQSDQGF